MSTWAVLLPRPMCRWTRMETLLQWHRISQRDLPMESGNFRGNDTNDRQGYDAEHLTPRRQAAKSQRKEKEAEDGRITPGHRQLIHHLFFLCGFALGALAET